MNETARKLMKRIDVVALRKEAVKAYEASFGPLTIEDADDACTWSWLTERWPWEGEV